jgi:hypothetical protein
VLVALVRGRATRARRGPLELRPIASVGSHTLVRVLTPDPARARAGLAALGHPVVGDSASGDRATNRYFAERWGLDRAFVHRGGVEWAGGRLRSPLAPDLVALLEWLGAQEALAALGPRASRLC